MTECPFKVKNCQDCADRTFTKENERVKYIVADCRKKQDRQRMIVKCGLFGKDLQETFQNAILDKFNRGAYGYIQQEWDRRKWQYLWSNENGTGKSYTANAIANMLIDEEIQPLVKREIDMANELKFTFKDKTGDQEYALMGTWKCIPVLIIQDFGKYGSNSEWWPQQIYDIIDYRLINKHTTVFTSNINVESREAMINRFGHEHGPAIYSRLNGICDIWEMTGTDRRLEV